MTMKLKVKNFKKRFISSKRKNGKTKSNAREKRRFWLIKMWCIYSYKNNLHPIKKGMVSNITTKSQLLKLNNGKPVQMNIAQLIAPIK